MVSGGAAKRKPGAVPSGDGWAQHGGLPQEVGAGPHPSAPASQQWRVLGAQGERVQELLVWGLPTVLQGAEVGWWALTGSAGGGVVMT